MTTRHWLTRLGAFLAGALLLTASPAHAADDEILVLENCVDGRGRTVATEADYAQAALVVRAVDDDGQPYLRYNPDALPRLSAAARQFFYAGRCAADDRRDGASPAEARRADCSGLAALLAGGLLDASAVPPLQRELETLGDADWAQLPGPRRTFDLAHCPPPRGNVLRLPLPATPSAQQTARNDCVRGCADRLWTCDRRCRGESCARCQTDYELCNAACGDAAGGSPGR